MTKGWHALRKPRAAKNKAFLKILLLVTTCTLTVVLVLSTILYHAAHQLITEQSIQMSMQSFQQIRSTFDLMRTTANSVATQVLLEETCSGLLLSVDEKAIDPIETYKAIRQMKLYTNVNESLDSIYIINRGIDKLYTSEVKGIYAHVADFYDKEFLDILDHYPAYQDRVLIKRTVQKSYENGFMRDHDVYTYIAANMYDGKQLQSAIAINISSAWLVENILASQPLQEGMMEIIDIAESSPLLQLNMLSAVPRDALKAPVQKMIQEGKNHCVFSYQGHPYFISHLFSPQIGWSFVKVVPWSSVFGLLDQLSRIMFIAVLFIALLGIGASLLCTGWIYRLYGLVESKYNQLADSKRENANPLQASFLNDFVLGIKQYPPTQLPALLTEYAVPLQAQELCTLVALKIDHFEQLKERYAEIDLHSIKYGLQNIFEEVFSASFRAVGIPDHQDYLLFIIANTKEPTGQETISEAFVRFCGTVNIFIDNNYNLVGTSRQVRVDQLYELWPDISYGLAQTFFYPSNTYVDCTQAHCEHSRTISPKQLKHGILEALRNADLRGAKQEYEQFTLFLLHACFEDYINLMTWLGFSIARVLGGYEKEQDHPDFFTEFLFRIKECEKKTEVDQLFVDVFTRVCAVIEAANSKTGAMGKMDKVQAYIREHYREPDLTLDHIANEFSLSTAYLGKIFKKLTALSIAEYINQCRLEDVVAQMAHSSRSIKELSESCGFSPGNYFYTYFKKRYGLTPQAYREKLASTQASQQNAANLEE
ncbi:MAG: helix-turn-helix domain-containing protein [Clostridia bacterium]